jgi:hypothetical protein
VCVAMCLLLDQRRYTHVSVTTGALGFSTNVIFKKSWRSINQSISEAWALERTIPTERMPLVGEVSANLADKRCHVVRVTDPYGRIIGFLDRRYTFTVHYLFFRDVYSF